MADGRTSRSCPKRFRTRPISNLSWSSFSLRYSVGVAVGALHGVDVVRALCRLECRVHLFYIQATVGELRVAGGARRSRRLSMLLVAGEATQAFVHADRGAVVAGRNLGGGRGRVALVAKRLTLIRADLQLA